MIKIITKLIIFIGLFFAISAAKPAHAYTQTRLMDNQVFDNVGAMNEDQIRSFLNQRPSSCLVTSGAIFPEPMDYWTYGPANVDAARVIYKAAQYSGVNPQVIIATLQKEQSLITRIGCFDGSIDVRPKAMGMGCPDNGPCPAPAYAGFEKQVMKGTWQLAFNRQRAEGNVGWGDNGSITYGGFMTRGTFRRCSSCSLVYFDGYANIDGQSVLMENGTTASLYTYTPHLGQSFPGIFEGWFGPALVATYAWEFVSQGSNKNLSTFAVGQKATLTLTAKNVGTATWTNSGSNPVHLAASNPQDRSSKFSTPSWLSAARAANLNETSVPSGSTGTFTFVIQAPSSPGSYREYFNLVSEGITWMNDPGLNYSINVISQSLSGAVISSTVPAIINTDATQSATVTVRNDSNVTWYRDGLFPIDLGTYNPTDRTSQFQSSNWLGSTRPARMTQASVEPGSNATFTFNLTAPHAPVNITESYSLVAEGLNWFNQAITQTINVKGTFTATGQSNSTINLIAGQSTSVTLSFTNNGTATWSNTGANPVKLGTTSPQDRMSSFCDPSWPSCNRPDLLNESSVAPGSTGTFTFTLKSSPTQTGTYYEDFLPLAEGQEWFGSPSRVTINVAPPRFSWSVAGQEAYTDSSKSQGLDLMSLSPGQTAWLVLKAKNTGNTTWQKAGSNPVHLGTEGPRDHSSIFSTSAWLGANRPATLVLDSVAPDATGTFEFPIKILNRSGNFFERFNLVVEGLTWMNDTGLGYSMKINNGYSWALVGQEAYTNAALSAPADLTNLTPDAVTYWRVRAKNTGSATWFRTGDFPLDLGTSHNNDRSSKFCDLSDTPAWLGCNRAARLKETSVAPGTTGTFEFSAKAPAAGTYHEYLNPVVESILWLNDTGMNFYSVVH